MGIITISGFEAATNADVTANSRLVTVPPGQVKIEIIAADNVAANNYTVSLTLPGGEAPWLDLLVPGGATAGLAGVMDDRLSLSGTYNVPEAGHVTLSCTETGDTEMYWRMTSLS